MSEAALSEAPRRRRGGGRAGRIAVREAVPQPDRRPVRPGLPAGRFRPLSAGDMQLVYDTALSLLEDVGMGDPLDEFVEAAVPLGAWIDDAGRIRLPRSIVERAIETAAKEWIWHGFDDDRSVQVGGDHVYFGTAGAAVMIYDHVTGTFRDSVAQDVYDCGRLVDVLDNLHFYVRTVVARDIVEARHLDLTTAYAVMCSTTKPGGSSWFDPRWVYESVEMFDFVLGGAGEFEKRPFIAANNTFVVPPLRFAPDSAHCLVAQVRTGMPINLLSALQAGATAPAALAGALAQAVAECLGGLTFVNLLSPGHPCLLGLWPFVSDLRTGAMSGGSGEEGILNAAAAEIGRWLGLPTGVAAGMTDSKVNDAQAGYEKGLNVGLAGHAGANLVYESAGMLASLLACSYEALVIDNDMLGAINRTVRGIEVNADTLSAELIAEVIAGPGHFLGSPQTLELMESEYLYPLVSNRDTPEDWTDAGSKAAHDVAHDHVNAVLEHHWPTHISAATDTAVRDAFPIHLPAQGPPTAAPVSS
ncbi:trimethylamine methyltransferase family protein [Candidatus Poriferisodalis sp.]|uniref:trimethylamine methyltransferase family protein n=1 Tax=Candidatus Poriferisodalis sp. TaxID=3101277 RepID=UPI003B029404